MGLDISFNKQAAEDAGMHFSIGINGTPHEIGIALLTRAEPGYVSWLKERVTTLKLPSPHSDGYCREYHEFDGNMSVRANRWGDFYKPLTRFLKENRIEWSEH